MIDVRLFALLETLTSSNLGWLAEEVLHDILAGQISLESEASVLRARGAIFRGDQSDISFEAQEAAESVSTPYEVEEQLGKAVSYICRRLEDAISMLRACAERLDTVINAGGAELVESRAGPSSVLLLTDGSAVAMETNALQLVEAERAVRDLREELQRWLSNGAEDNTA